MPWQERVWNLVFGGSLIFWAVAGSYQAIEANEIGVIRIMVTILNLLVGSLIIGRRPLRSNNAAISYRAVLISIPSVLCGGVLFKLSESLISWPLTSKIIFIVGAVITIVAFIFLGKNFSIFPRIRKVSSGGLFKLIRHPAYFGELLMSLACFLAMESWYSIPVFIVLIPGLYFRILEEERLLMNSSPEYLKYTIETKWRLIPYIW